jgi:protein ImuA
MPGKQNVMAIPALAQETVFTLRRKIANIEGRLAEHLGEVEEDAAGRTLLRRHGLVLRDGGLLAIGAERFDAALGGGLPRAALTEVHGPTTRDAAAAAGFVLAAISVSLGPISAPVLWIGTSEVFRETGLPYAPGMLSLFGIDSGRLIVAETPKLADALWIAEEAARLKGFSAVLLEIRGNPSQMDLAATRRLHFRAREAGRPVFLLRQTAKPEPTAAPVRLLVSSASSGLRRTLAGPLAGSIGPPGFTIAISKNRTSPPTQFTLEWNPHEHNFTERRTENPFSVVPVSQYGTHIAQKAGTVLAFRPEEPAAGRQPSGEEYPVHRRLG